MHSWVIADHDGSRQLGKDIIHDQTWDVLLRSNAFQTNASATYQCLVNRMFKEQIVKMREVYINDMLVKSL